MGIVAHIKFTYSQTQACSGTQNQSNEKRWSGHFQWFFKNEMNYIDKALLVTKYVVSRCCSRQDRGDVRCAFKKFQNYV